MTDIRQIDDYFRNHPLQEQYLKFSVSERTGAANVAARDVAAALDNAAVTGTEQDTVSAAIAEQTIFLLLNPEYLTGTAAPVTGARTEALLKPLLASRSQITINRG